MAKLTEAKCPACGEEMEERQRKRDGHKFLGRFKMSTPSADLLGKELIERFVNSDIKRPMHAHVVFPKNVEIPCKHCSEKHKTKFSVTQDGALYNVGGIQVLNWVLKCQTPACVGVYLVAVKKELKMIRDKAYDADLTKTSVLYAEQIR